MFLTIALRSYSQRDRSLKIPRETQEKRNLLDTTTKDQSSMFQQKSGTQNQTQGDMTAFSQNCKISIKNTTSRMSSSAFQDAVVCL